MVSAVPMNIIEKTYRYTDNYCQVPKNIDIKPPNSILEWKDMTINKGELLHQEIPMFTFPSLNEIRKEYLKKGYSSKEVNSMIAGLSELPEYARSNGSKKSLK
ncbi:hypothetical protein A2313_00790 [Candidatus Roizmanbacteria bacterium RIFOXYB2_FULL_41_10]|uniref:Uncharacterized protein n=1 Tax=Candidatus Roizmanbacteria bacterium RIFOXYA1_FULL_41_12 TaxID=1802082 RepID=A0A1F7K970_9BACT|nr:MAG: hypothetical protein A2209_03775 [Candidatus Roizmanbacteria bacterium RIFOXYA1_FULL_41_12]OGK67881.1 MAG: hypothetical protein A2377_02155 [Candidatus Roizmanbacteria bacterium RIFOXYB1_FULL_41_27]OGK68242.1 MAG: hypothetical protein A2262_00205 [Candidatus Roizmanbacteria bacterium RIFOXYA2_FULL_41_8]OGK68863.1 MAG: hypothetical protein A2313_00790 [Candidatus Roizmanbacteria bacterium RIFOXYB2_FULL_41_10]OGK72009.1 MAG: hypothetical protein A2403_03580 [Candidatus Roizmanbacteria bac